MTDSNQDGTQPAQGAKADGTQPAGNAANAGKTYTQAEFDSAMGELRRKSEKQLARKTEEARQQAIRDFLTEKGLDEAALAKLGSGDDIAKAERARAQAEKVAADSKALADLKTKELRQYRAMSEVIKAATNQRAIEPELVWTLVRDRIALDDDELQVVDEHGKPTEKTINDLVGTLLASKDYLVRPTAPAGGAGSRPSSGNGTNGMNLLDPKVRKAHLAGYFGR